LEFSVPTQTIHIDRVATAKDIPQTKVDLEELQKSADAFAPKGEGVIPPGPRAGKGYFASDLPDKKLF
jgi:hypothetical protein